MTFTAQRGAAQPASAQTHDRSVPGARPARLVLASRGDALVPHLTAALRSRYQVVKQVDAELTRVERFIVAAKTFRPSRRAWVERFFKSGLAVSLRSRRVARELAGDQPPFDAILQTHALFEVTDPRTVLYVDCTHQQSAVEWPDWNPLSGRALRRWFERERRQYASAAHLFVFSRATRTSLVKDYGVPPHRVTVVGAGVNFDDLPRPAHRAGSLAPPTVLFVGNDFVRKGGRELLDAFRLVRSRVPDARLQIVGTPHPIARQPGVEVLGSVTDRDQLSALYAEANLFCLPSLFDPFPLVVLEAMAHGLPCVVTPTCGVPEMVEEGTTALMATPGPGLVQSLADLMLELLENPARASAMGAAARRRVEQRFLWTHVVDRMSPVLDTLASRRHHCVGRRVPREPRDRRNLMAQAVSPTTTTLSERPWGSFTQFTLNEESTVKIITVEPGCRLSKQRHQHRGELWQVLDGPTDIEVDGATWTARRGEQIWVPRGSTHRLANSSAETVRVLEIAFGRFDELDIERLEDDYSR